MADTCRSDYPNKFCVWCGSKGCHIKHWGPLFNEEVVYLDNCITNLGHDHNIPRFNCETGEPKE